MKCPECGNRKVMWADEWDDPDAETWCFVCNPRHGSPSPRVLSRTRTREDETP